MNMNAHVRLSELNLLKKELEAELSQIRGRIKRGADQRERKGLHERREQIIDELLAAEKEASQLRLAFQLEAKTAAEQPKPAVESACLLVLQWDGKYVYYATRENVNEWQCEMILELGQDAPVVLRVSGIAPELVDKLPGWLWKTPDEREDEEEPVTTLFEHEPIGCAS